jgi:hypothetical protein
MFASTVFSLEVGTASLSVNVCGDGVALIADCFPEVAGSSERDAGIAGCGCDDHEITGSDDEVVARRTGVLGSGDERGGSGCETPRIGVCSPLVVV